MASMVRPIPSSKNGRYALAALSYLAVLYGTLGLTPPFFRWLSATLGGAGYSLAITLFLLAMAGLALWNARGRLTGLGPPGAAGLALVAIGYGLIFLWVPAPATRLHTLQYGALSWLVTGALRGRGPVGGPAWRLHAGTLVLVCAAAVGDETIQWFLPNRFGLPADVALDWLSAALAQAAIFLLRDRARGAAPPAARFWRTFSSQGGSKTF